MRRGKKRQGSGRQWGGGVQSNPIQPDHGRRGSAAVTGWKASVLGKRRTPPTPAPPRGDRSRAPDPTPPPESRRIPAPAAPPRICIPRRGSPPDRLAPSSPQILCKQWIDAAGLGRRNHLINHQMQMRHKILIMQNRKIKLQNLCKFHPKHMHILLSQRKK